MRGKSDAIGARVFSDLKYEPISRDAVLSKIRNRKFQVLALCAVVIFVETKAAKDCFAIVANVL
jgi:hypothetical protein